MLRVPASCVIGMLLVVVMLGSACGAPENEQPACRSDSPTILMAESVPTASLVPCVDALPAGWTYHTFEADESAAAFSLEQQDGDGQLEVQLLSSCQATGERVALGGFPTVQQYRSVEDGGALVVWTSTFPGGCVREQLSFPAPPTALDVDRIHRAISFLPRDSLQPA
jgi:hypothetical protein